MKKRNKMSMDETVKRYAYKDDECKIPLQGEELEKFKEATRGLDAIRDRMGEDAWAAMNAEADF